MPPLGLLIKPSSGMCNLQCSYCFYRDITQYREKQNYGFITVETLENIIKKALAYAEGFCSFGYQGGEPTLIGTGFYKKAVELQNKYNSKGIKICNSIQTNGYQLNEEWAKFFKQNNFLVGLSLDGMKKTHDSCRRNARGEGTFTDIMAVTDIFDKYQVEYNLLTVVNSFTAKRVQEIYQFYRRKGFNYLQFIPCLDPIGDQGEKGEYTLEASDYGEFLIKLFDLWYRDYSLGRMVYIREFDNYVRILAGFPAESCGMNGRCSIQNVVEADGMVYPCDFYVLDSYKLASLNDSDFSEIWSSSNAKKFLEESVKPAEKCLDCRYYSLCRGGCRRYRVLSGKDGGSLNKFCTSYKMFFDADLQRLLELAEKVKKR
ncbi:uncharacterized protein SAMN02745136_04871 [Anaerocolumna jejuensis DSM 15929]|uniref:Radical SAM core domain-containing protein n=1 Tax=Anaerocolumna jejuensis DSM 15929 TaxID=1121322 RepID=A0A1M7AI35_9FIRM|nr:anaerobic sulfatase maturase [Anaerocolumna jejuensis]SHL42149.1 uncharacterized protein SAMN02745136_04871 [Anaerocolumna jejuensis DSM 15929]